MVRSVTGSWLAAGMLVLAAFASGSPAVAAAPVAQGEGPPGIVIDQFHIIVSPQEDVVTVAEVYLLGNEGNEIYWGEDGVTVVFPLPEGAQQVSYEGAEDGSGPYRWVEGGIADTRPITPGVAMVEVRLGYRLAFEPGTRITHAVPVPVGSGVLLLAGTTWKLGDGALESGLFTDMGVMNFGGETARAYTIDALGAGDVLTFDIAEEAMPAGDLVAPGQMMGAAEEGESAARVVDGGLGLGIGVIAVAGAAAAAYGLWRRPVSGVISSVPPSRIEEDLNALVELDAEYAEGQIDAPTYERLRRALKARVRAALHDRNSKAD